jgi:hypothetical protein
MIERPVVSDAGMEQPHPEARAMPARPRRARRPSLAAARSTLVPAPLRIERPVAALAHGFGWVTPAPAVVLPAPTPSIKAHARPHAAKERAGSRKSVAGRGAGHVPASHDPARHGGAATAASGGSVAPPSVDCALFATRAALAAQEMRRLRARMLVPVAPSAPSLRDRPG